MANVSSVFPIGGPTVGGTVVTVNGGGFAAEATCKFGGTATTNVTVLSSSRVLCASPVHAAVHAAVVVSNNGQQYTSGSVTFQYYGM